MIIIDHGHIWRSSYTWSPKMVIEFGVWGTEAYSTSCMIIKYDHRTWQHMCSPYIYEHHIWSTYMSAIHYHHSWSPYIYIYVYDAMIIIYDHHRLSSYVALSTIYYSSVKNQLPLCQESVIAPSTMYYSSVNNLL